jgi:hypothetical protein
MQTPITIPSPADIPAGIIVRTDFCIYRGRNSYRAVHKRDAQTTWKTIIQSPGSDTGHEKVLAAWMASFTGPESKGFVADYKVVARGGDWNGYYWVLQPTNYN